MCILHVVNVHTMLMCLLRFEEIVKSEENVIKKSHFEENIVLLHTTILRDDNDVCFYGWSC